MIGLLVLTGLAYARVVTFGLVYDDAGWLWPWRGNGRLGPMSPFQAAAWIGGGLPWAYHALVLGLHLLNGGLVYTLARRWLSEYAALIVLMLFWLHPIQVEAVAYVSGGIEVLLTTYVLIAVCGLVSSSLILNGIGAGSLLLAGTMKPSALPLLVAVPVLVWRMKRAGHVPRRATSPVLPECSRSELPARSFIIALFALAAGAFAWGHTVAAYALRSASLSSRIAALSQLAASVCRYLALLIWPVGFSIEHPASGSVVALIALACIGLLAFTVRSRWAAPSWACAWLAVLLLPRALVPHDVPPLTEHHLYLPFLSVWMTAGSALDRLSFHGVT